MKKRKVNSLSNNVFLPYYINNGRLIDIYAILNDGYAEFSEITTENIDSKNRNVGFGVSGGFKLLSLGKGEVSGRVNNNKVRSNKYRINQKRIQTLPSMLNQVIIELSKMHLLKKAHKNVEEGMFLEVPVSFKVNSIPAVLSELHSLAKLFNNMEKIKNKSSKNNKSKHGYEEDIKKILDTFTEDNIEIIYDTDEFAYISYINEENLYQSSITDLFDKNLICLCQVKNIYKSGTDLLKYNILSKVKDKQSFISQIIDLTANKDFNFDNKILPSIKGKPVYDIEIIALYKKVFSTL